PSAKPRVRRVIQSFISRFISFSVPGIEVSDRFDGSPDDDASGGQRDLVRFIVDDESAARFAFVDRVDDKKHAFVVFPPELPTTEDAPRLIALVPEMPYGVFMDDGVLERLAPSDFSGGVAFDILLFEIPLLVSSMEHAGAEFPVRMKADRALSIDR